jgi:hypothetical protein
MMVRQLVGRARTGLPLSGWCFDDVVPAGVGLARVGGRQRVAMQGRPAGTPGFMPSQPSSLPTNSSLDSLCSRIWRMVPAPAWGTAAPTRHRPSRWRSRSSASARCSWTGSPPCRRARAPGSAGAPPCGAPGPSPRARCSRAPRRRPCGCVKHHPLGRGLFPVVQALQRQLRRQATMAAMGWALSRPAGGCRKGRELAKRPAPQRGHFQIRAFLTEPGQAPLLAAPAESAPGAGPGRAAAGRPTWRVARSTSVVSRSACGAICAPPRPAPRGGPSARRTITDSAQMAAAPAGSGSSSVACAATWWRTLATAAGPRPQLSHSAAPSASWLTPKPACSSAQQVGVGVGGAQHGAVVVGAWRNSTALPHSSNSPAECAAQASSDRRCASRPISRPRRRHAATAAPARARAETRRAGPSRR